MDKDTREVIRDVVQRTAKVVTIWANQAIPATAPGGNMGDVRAGATMFQSIPTPTTDDLMGQARISMRIFGSRYLGDDETRYVYDGAHDKLVPLLTGLRTLTLAVTCMTYGMASEISAADILENLRTRLQRDRVAAELRAVNISLVDMHDVTDFQVQNSTTAGQMATLDLKLGWAFNDLDPDDLGEYFTQVTTPGTGGIIY
jgi:hypothetical protein